MIAAIKNLGKNRLTFVILTVLLVVLEPVDVGLDICRVSYLVSAYTHSREVCGHRSLHVDLLKIKPILILVDWLLHLLLVRR